MNFAILETHSVDDLMCSDEYAEFIMENAHGDRVICNGDALIEAMESSYLFNEFLASIGVEDEIN